MNLIYFTKDNLQDRLFIQDFVFNFKFKEKTVVFHAPFGETLRDTRFVTKRISSLLSEAMVYNNFLMGDQRDSFVLQEDGTLEMNTKAIHELLYTASLLVLGPLVKSNAQVQVGDSIHMLQVAREALEAQQVFLFPSNPKSPLATKKPMIDNREEVDRLLSIYEEEAEILELAYQIRPVRLVSPINYSMEIKS